MASVDDLISCFLQVPNEKGTELMNNRTKLAVLASAYLDQIEVYVVRDKLV